jgi:hypothetical protein
MDKPVSDHYIITILFGGAWVVLGLLLAAGKVRFVMRYRKEEQPAPWPEEKDAEDEEPVANYVKSVESEATDTSNAAL